MSGTINAFIVGNGAVRPDSTSAAFCGHPREHGAQGADLLARQSCAHSLDIALVDVCRRADFGLELLDA
jgi:hypothetical protein